MLQDIPFIVVLLSAPVSVIITLYILSFICIRPER
jgi:hypothetical protein